MTGDSA